MYKKNLVFIAACLGMLLFGVVFLSLGTALTFIKIKFAIDDLTAGSLASSLPFGMLLGSIIFGPVVDRYGYKNLLIICSLLILVAFEGIALAASLLVLQISFFLIGFGGGVINGGTNALVADISSEGKGANLSLLGVFFGIGALGMPIVLGALTKYFTYEAVIASIGALVILPVLFFLVIKFPTPKQTQGFPIKQSLSLIKEGSLILMGFILFFESGLEGTVGNWTTTFLKDKSFSPEDALYVLSVQVAALTLTRLILGGLLKRMRSYIVLIISYACIFAGALVLAYANTFGIAAIAMILLGIGFAAGFPVILGYVSDIYSALSGTAFSIVLVMALTGNTLLNLSVGAISQSMGIKLFPIVLMISVLLMSVFFGVVIKKISIKIKI
ncbi:MAG: MFS transporter [Ignavibacteriales bacterium]|nr:MFS transporter [Ignavibacteriales bacterium]